MVVGCSRAVLLARFHNWVGLKPGLYNLPQLGGTLGCSPQLDGATGLTLLQAGLQTELYFCTELWTVLHDQAGSRYTPKLDRAIGSSLQPGRVTCCSLLPGRAVGCSPQLGSTIGWALRLQELLHGILVKRGQRLYSTVGWGSWLKSLFQRVGKMRSAAAQGLRPGFLAWWGLEVMFSRWAVLLICFAIWVELQIGFYSLYGPFAGDPNQAKLPTKLFSQMRPSSWVYEQAVAGWDFCLCATTTRTQSTKIHTLIAMSPPALHL